MQTRLRHLWLALVVLPALLRNERQRRLFAEMRALSRRLPQIMKRPLPEAMQALGAGSNGIALPENDVRRLADLAALLSRRSPLGYCLRRSLLRYHFLRRAGLPLGVAFGARLRANGASHTKASNPSVAGHAWVVLGGIPYHEADENWRNFRVIYRWPQGE